MGAIRHLLRRLLDEGGAISVDYVVLSAACTGLGFATVTYLDDSFGLVSDTVRAEVATDETVGRNAGSYLAYDPTAFATDLDALRTEYQNGVPSDLEEAMRAMLTDHDDVVFGREDDYAAHQIVLEELGGTLPDGWPDYRTL